MASPCARPDQGSAEVHRVFGVSVLLFIAASSVATAPRAGVPAAAIAPPYILATLQSFHGRLDYTAHRIGNGPAVAISGVGIIGDAAWTVDERAPGYSFHAAGDGATLLIGSTAARSDDPLNADPLANAWAVALAELASTRLSPRAGSTTVWATPAGVIFYTDAAQNRVLGLTDRITPSSPSFVFEGWLQMSGVPLPQRILRLRNGLSDATFAVDSYHVTRSIGPGDGAALAGPAFGSPLRPGDRTTLYALRPLGEPVDFPWRLVLSAFGMMLLAICIVAWTRRDALVSRYCLWLAHDPREWRGIGSSIFVSADGLMYFDECVYKVGAQFYARNPLGQSSPLFLRISAAQVPKAVIVPRKFRPMRTGRALAPSRARSAGFSLIEALIATACFTTVIVGGVFPALIVVARSNAVAAQHRAAVLAASNALTDQEIASAYGSVVDGTATSSVDGQIVTVDVHPSATSGAHDIIVSVTDVGGNVLARVATTVGPAVPAPGSQTPPAGGGCAGGGRP